MHSEQRKENRSIAAPQPKGKLQVILGDQFHNVSAVKDTSPTGIRLKMGAQIKIGENILVRYLDEKVDLQVNGIVVWNSISSEGVEDGAETNEYIIGIKLASPSLLAVFL
jgi:hypothetical protein